jgi:hypothetical protein
MSLRPDGTRLLVIRSADGEVLYEGDGQVQVGMDPAAIPGVDGPRTDRESARGLVLHVDTDTDEQEDGRTWGDMVRATIQNQIRARAEAVHTILEAYGLGPEVLGPPSPAAREYWDALYDTARRARMEREDDLSAWEGRWRTVCEGRISPEARDMIMGTGPSPEHDELIAATRSEFPYDPLDYGRFGREEMAWSPPEDGQEVPRCP